MRMTTRVKMYGRKMRRERTHLNDFDTAPRSWNRMLRRIQRKRDRREAMKDLDKGN